MEREDFFIDNPGLWPVSAKIYVMIKVGFTHVVNGFNRVWGHNGLKTGTKRTPIFWLAIAVKTLSDSIYSYYLQLKTH